jgi:hypothetical protein
VIDRIASRNICIYVNGIGGCHFLGPALRESFALRQFRQCEFLQLIDAIG